MNKQHIVKAFYQKTQTIVYIFYDIKSRLYSGHFICDPISKESMLTTIQKSFPPNFDVIGDYNILLYGSVDFLIMNTNNGVDRYTFFDELIKIDTNYGQKK